MQARPFVTLTERVGTNEPIYVSVDGIVWIAAVAGGYANIGTLDGSVFQVRETPDQVLAGLKQAENLKG